MSEFNGRAPLPVGCGPVSTRSRSSARATGRPSHRIVFLDVEARELGRIPALYFTEDDVIKYAHEAGIAYRSYSFAFAGDSSTRVSPGRLCEALFVRSARWVKLVSEELDMGSDWFTAQPVQDDRWCQVELHRRTVAVHGVSREGRTKQPPQPAQPRPTRRSLAWAAYRSAIVVSRFQSA